MGPKQVPMLFGGLCEFAFSLLLCGEHAAIILVRGFYSKDLGM